MQALTFLFLLFNALSFVHAAMVPHDVDMAPRHVNPLVERALAEATTSTVRIVLRSGHSQSLIQRVIDVCSPNGYRVPGVPH